MGNGGKNPKRAKPPGKACRLCKALVHTATRPALLGSQASLALYLNACFRAQRLTHWGQGGNAPPAAQPFKRSKENSGVPLEALISGQHSNWPIDGSWEKLTERGRVITC